MQVETPIHTDLYLVGGGHTHAIVLRKIGMEGLPAGVRVTLVTNLVDTPYSGMLPCHISGTYGFDESHIDLRPLTRFARCRLIMDEVVHVDPNSRQIHCRSHPPLDYDVLSIDIGSTPQTLSVPGAAAHAIPAKPVPDLLRAWNTYLDELSQASAPSAVVGIVGGGVGGVELALNMQMRLRQLTDRVDLHLFHRGSRLATGRSRTTQRQLAQIFRDRNIHTHLQESVCAVEPLDQTQGIGPVRVRCESGLAVTCDRVFWVTNASAAAWIAKTGLSTDAKGFIQVRDTLQSCSHSNVFAAGDIATMVHAPRPKAGVFAVRQGPPLYKNLRRYLQHRSLRPFTPQRQFLNIIDLGDGSAIASRGPWSARSVWFRRWKHWIDSKFMGLFEQFPDMEPHRHLPAAAKTTAAPPCAGCGSKVGRSVLSRALAKARDSFPELGHPPETICIGLEQPDDAAIVTLPPGTQAVQTVDQFRALVDDPYIFAQVCLNHCLSDLFAMGATPQTVLAIAVLPYATDAVQTATLYQLMAGTYQALLPTGAWLVGGHTSEGPELSLGFACNGWIQPGEALTKGLTLATPQEELALILTQPLGVGVLFAADMQRAAKGRWIDAAVAAMLRSDQAAAACLRRHGLRACTDVTGFGLAGHLYEMWQASPAPLCFELESDALPVLPGAQRCFESGYRSSLHERNRQIAQQFGPCPSQAKALPILFDPQTAGGLVGAVPIHRVSDCLLDLHRSGYAHSRCIGRVIPARPGQPAFTIR